jgi:hypothetical protein
MQNSINEELLK